MRIRSLFAALLALVMIATSCSSDGGAVAGDGTWPSEITFGFVPSAEL